MYYATLMRMLWTNYETLSSYNREMIVEGLKLYFFPSFILLRMTFAHALRPQCKWYIPVCKELKETVKESETAIITKN
jgi:hypothetical protein